MAQEKAKKGFFFYFGFFLLALIAAVLVIFVVMLFMPGKSILGLEYFAGTGTTYVEKTTPQPGEEEGEVIDFKQPNFSSVEIDAGYSEVCIQKNFDYKDSGIYIINEAKGFVTSKSANDFAYSVTIEEGVLKIKVTEQNAFLYFSKNAKIILQISDANVNTFENMNITIKNDGFINIGGRVVTGKSSQVFIGGLDIDNASGGISISSLADNIYDNFLLSSQSGNIAIVPGSIDAQQAKFNVGSGKLSATTITSANTVEITSEKGTIDIVSINSKLVAEVKNAYMTIGTVKNGVDFSNSPFSSAVVNIKEVEQGGLKAPNGKDTDFTLGSISGKTEIETSTGNIEISEPIVTGSRLETSTGNITAQLALTASDVEIKTSKGNVKVKVPQVTNLGRLVTISNETGETNVTLNENGPYNVRFYYYGVSETAPHMAEFRFDNVALNRDLNVKNPLVINSTNSEENVVVLKCNKKINFTWSKSVNK